MPSNVAPSGQSRQYIRLDTEHHVLELMQRAVGRLAGSSVKIRMSGDAVLLSGTVRSWYEKQNIQESIRKFTGHREISNAIDVCRNW